MSSPKSVCVEAAAFSPLYDSCSPNNNFAFFETQYESKASSEAFHLIISFVRI